MGIPDVSNDIRTQAELAIARERAQWSALIDQDDGTPAVWEDLVRRSIPHVTRGFFFPRWEANSALTPGAGAFDNCSDYYGLTTELAAEWGAYAERWERFLNANPKMRIAAMLGDVSETHDASSFPYGWSHIVRDWAQAGFPAPAPFDDRSRVIDDAWKATLADAMHRAGPGWVYWSDNDTYEWR